MDDVELSEYEIALATLPAPQPDESGDIGQAVYHRLVDAGLSREAARAEADAITDLAERHAIPLAAECVGRLLHCIEGTSGGESLRLAALGDSAGGVREAARRAGVSWPAIIKQRDKLAKRLEGLPLPPLVA